MTPWTATRQASLSFTNSQSLLKLMSIQSVMPSNHLILCHPLLILPSVFPSVRVFSSELVLHIRWPKYWSFSFSISPSNEYSGMISFRIDWFDLLGSMVSSIFRVVHPSPQSYFRTSPAKVPCADKSSSVNLNLTPSCRQPLTFYISFLWTLNMHRIT